MSEEGDMAQTFEARLTTPESIERVQAAKRPIEQVRGTLRMVPTRTPGVVIVLLTLPDGYHPESILPGIPFFLT